MLDNLCLLWFCLLRLLIGLFVCGLLYYVLLQHLLDKKKLYNKFLFFCFKLNNISCKSNFTSLDDLIVQSNVGNFAVVCVSGY